MLCLSSFVFGQDQTLIDSLYNVVNSNAGDTTKINALCSLSKEYCGTDNIKAFQLANDALKLSDKVKDKKFAAQSLLRAGSTYDYRMQWDSALVYYLNSLKLYEQLNDQGGIASCYQNIGVMYYYQNDFNKAIDYYNRSLAIRLVLKDWKFVAKLYNNIGAILRKQKKYKDAISVYNQSLEIKKKQEDKKGMSTAYLNLGIVYSFIGSYDSAMYYCKKSLEIDMARGDKHDMASTQMAIGEILLNNNKAREAIEYLDKGILLAKEIDAKELLFNAYGYLAVADTLLDDFKRAYYNTKSYEYYQGLVINEQKSFEIEKLQALYQSEKKDASIKILKTEQEAKEREQKFLYWILTIISVFLIVIILFYISKRRDNILLQKQKQEIIDKTELLKQQAAEIAVFKTQINPHFIFNAINSVQQFIIINDKEKAMTSLVDLSKLIRDTLNYSDKEYIELSEEIGFLNEYFKFEKLRSNFPLDIRIEVAANLDPDEIEIPPMILQPFIENAVKHGLLPKKAPGHVKVSFMKDADEELLNIRIEDDGVGIDHSRSSKVKIGHRSRGIDITLNRIRSLYNRLNIHEPDFFNISEIKENTGTKGTCVKIVLPYIQKF